MSFSRRLENKRASESRVEEELLSQQRLEQQSELEKQKVLIDEMNNFRSFCEAKLLPIFEAIKEDYYEGDARIEVKIHYTWDHVANVSELSKRANGLNFFDENSKLKYRFFIKIVHREGNDQDGNYYFEGFSMRVLSDYSIESLTEKAKWIWQKDKKVTLLDEGWQEKLENHILETL